MTRANTIQDFWAKVEKTSTCWLWRGGSWSNGYGRFQMNNVAHPTHRLAYQLLVGPIPDGLVLDHLCRNTICVNPEHLEPVTNRVNILRGISPWAKNARVTHCPVGHRLEPFDPTKVGHLRKCRECDKHHNAKYRERNHQRLLSDPSLAPHGTMSTYVSWLCRCPDCTRANSEYMKAYRARRAEAGAA